MQTTTKADSTTITGKVVVVLLYTGHADVAASEPPTFVAVGEGDGIAPHRGDGAALRRAGTEVEYHTYPGVGHGFGLGIGTSAEGWIGDAVRFWAKHVDRRGRLENGME